MSFSRWLHAAWLGLALDLPARAQNQNHNLSGPFPGSIAGDVQSYRFLPDGSALYVADQDTDEVHELYFVAPSGGVPRKLSGALVEGGDVLATPGRQGFMPTLDGTRVVYMADQDIDDVLELFVVPVNGSAPPRKLNRPFGPGASLYSFGSAPFQLSPDGARVVYLAHDERHGTTLELHSAMLDGSAPPVQLNALATGTTARFGIVPGGRFVLFTANPYHSSAFELFRVPIDGSAAPQRINVPFDQGSVDFQISPDGQRVVFRFWPGQLLSAPIDPGYPIVSLNGPGLAGRGVSDYRISPDGRHVVFLGDLTLDEVYELHSVPIAGGTAPRVLNGALVAGGDVAPGFRISPNGARVVYRADQDIDDVPELYSVALEGGPAVKLSDALPAGRSVADDFALGWLGQRVVYRSDRDGERVFELFSAPLRGGAAALKLSGPLAPGASVLAGFLASESRAFYLADDADASDARELFSVPLDGGAAPSAISAPLVEGGNVADFAVSPDGTRVLYRADQDAPLLHELFGASATGSGLRRISAPIQPGPILRDVRSFAPTNDGAHVLYVVDEESDGNDVLELFRVRADGGGERALLATVATRHFRIAADSSCAVFATTSGIFRVPLTGDVEALQIAPPGRLPSELEISPDSRHVVYWVGDGTSELRSVPLDGSLAPIVLATRGFRYGPWYFAAGRVLFTVGASLHSVPIDGSSPLALLNPAAVAGSSVLELQFTADGHFAVYRGDQEVRHRHELYSVPVDGSEPPSRRSALPVAGQDVQHGFQLRDDGIIVYDQTIPTSSGRPRHSLWRVAARGPTAPERIAAIGTGGTFEGLQLASGGARALYRYESSSVPAGLFSVELVSDATPLRIAAGAAPGYRLSRDGELVVFRTELEPHALHSVPVDGRRVPTRLSADLAVLPDFQLDPRDRHVIFRAGRELYFAPLSGHAQPARLHPPLVPGGAIQGDFRVTAHGVLYRADQQRFGVLELFLTALPGDVRAAGPLPRVPR